MCFLPTSGEWAMWCLQQHLWSHMLQVKKISQWGWQSVGHYLILCKATEMFKKKKKEKRNLLTKKKKRHYEGAAPFLCFLRIETLLQVSMYAILLEKNLEAGPEPPSAAAGSLKTKLKLTLRQLSIYWLWNAEAASLGAGCAFSACRNPTNRGEEALAS